MLDRLDEQILLGFSRKITEEYFLFELRNSLYLWDLGTLRAQIFVIRNVPRIFFAYSMCRIMKFTDLIFVLKTFLNRSWK